MSVLSPTDELCYGTILCACYLLGLDFSMTLHPQMHIAERRRSSSCPLGQFYAQTEKKLHRCLCLFSPLGGYIHLQTVSKDPTQSTCHLEKCVVWR